MGEIGTRRYANFSHTFGITNGAVELVICDLEAIEQNITYKFRFKFMGDVKIAAFTRNQQ